MSSCAFCGTLISANATFPPSSSSEQPPRHDKGCTTPKNIGPRREGRGVSTEDTSCRRCEWQQIAAAAPHEGEARRIAAVQRGSVGASGFFSQRDLPVGPATKHPTSEFFLATILINKKSRKPSTPAKRNNTPPPSKQPPNQIGSSRRKGTSDRRRGGGAAISKGGNNFQGWKWKKADRRASEACHLMPN